VWRFIAPVLYRNEKRFAVPFVLLTSAGAQLSPSTRRWSGAGRWRESTRAPDGDQFCLTAGRQHQAWARRPG
jgi:hypothetical protein